MNNADHAPWDEARWFQAAKESLETYMGLSSASECPIFQELLPYMVADSNEEHLLLDDEVVQRYWQELPEAWARTN
jgi:hypothetical protein